MQAYASVAGSGFFPSSSDKPVVPGFLLPVLVPFGLRGSSLPLATILVALSPDPKIPFLADVARARPMGARPQSRVVPFVDRFGEIDRCDGRRNEIGQMRRTAWKD